jgi:hypothetical protein
MMTPEPFEMLSESPELLWTLKDSDSEYGPVDPWPRALGGVEVDADAGLIRFLYRHPPYVTGRHAVELAFPNREMLPRFADLCREDAVVDGRLFSFASRYGGLGLCEKHGWPFAHTRPHCPTTRKSTSAGVQYRERIERWLFFSRLARAIVAGAASKEAEEQATAVAALKAHFALTTEEPQAIIRVAILYWLQVGELKVSFRGDARASRLGLYGVPPLWTALGMELATLAGGARRIILCGCGRLESIKHPRGNDDGRRSYCSKCRVKGRQRDAAVDLRRRRRLARELHAQGRSVAEIVRELGFQAAQVKRYLSQS